MGLWLCVRLVQKHSNQLSGTEEKMHFPTLKPLSCSKFHWFVAFVRFLKHLYSMLHCLYLYFILIHPPTTPIYIQEYLCIPSETNRALKNTSVL